MKVKATITFVGNHGENDDSGFWTKGKSQLVSSNRANELLRAGLVEVVEEKTAAPAAPAGNKEVK